MKTTHRNYSDENGDFNRLARFFTSNSRCPRIHTTWCLGRLVDWKYGLYENKRAFAAFCDENAHLWFDAFGELAGFSLSENGDASFNIITLEGYRFLYEEILQWTLDAWKERVTKKGPGFSTEITEHQDLERRVLEQYGFKYRSAFYTRRFDLTKELIPRCPLEPGYVIVDMQSHPDYRAQAIMRADAFQGKSTLSEDELNIRIKYYNHSHNGPIYHPQTDLCVMAEDGRFVSGCEALINAHCLEADIERVCTHGSFRKRGFARAVIQECLYRLRDMGIHYAYITGYSLEAVALYGSLGAVDEQRSFIYEFPIYNLGKLI
jgi:GNAT superfamily N-acetyltransferase